MDTRFAQKAVDKSAAWVYIDHQVIERVLINLCRMGQRPFSLAHPPPSLKRGCCLFFLPRGSLGLFVSQYIDRQFLFAHLTGYIAIRGIHLWWHRLQVKLVNITVIGDTIYSCSLNVNQ